MPATREELLAIWRGKLENLKLSWNEFETKALHLEARPFKFIIELTQNCNFRCVMCPQSFDEAFKKYHPEYNMPMELFTKIAEQIFPRATMVDLRGFGETTILPHWPEVVEYLERYPFIVWHLVTNLSLPRDDTWDRMIKLGFDLGFSCDGATAETFEAIRRRSNFERIRHNLGVIRDAIRRHGKGRIYFISTIQHRNVEELRAIVELAHEFEVPEVQFKIVKGDEFSRDLLAMDRAKVRGLVDASLDAAIALGIRVTFNDWFFTRDADASKVERARALVARTTPDPINTSLDARYWKKEGIDDLYLEIAQTVRVSEKRRCFKPFSYAYINYKGEMGTCNHMMYPDMMVMGDLKTQTLEEIWNSTRYQDFRNELLHAQPTDVRCQWCFKHRLDD